MSKIYFLDVIIDVQFQVLVSTVLERGSKEGFIYFLNETSANIEQVTYKLINPTAEDIDDGGPKVRVVYLDTMFVLWIKSMGNATRVNIDCSIGSWKKEFQSKFDSEMYLDFARYIRLILKLCEPFPIISIDCGGI